MTITINVNSILTWIGGAVCVIFALWALYWIFVWVVGVGEMLGIWNGISWMAQDFKKWLSKRLRREQP